MTKTWSELVGQLRDDTICLQAELNGLIKVCEENGYSYILDVLNEQITPGEHGFNRDTFVGDYTVADVARLLGIERTHMTKILREGRSLKVSSLDAFATYFVTGKSLHEVFFGEKWVLKLPRVESIFVDMLCDYSLKMLDELGDYIQKAYASELKASGPIMGDEVAATIKQRANDHLESIGIPLGRLSYFVSSCRINAEQDKFRGLERFDPCPRLTFDPPHIYPRKTMRGIEDGTSIRLRSLLIACVLLDVPLDYLICRDYASRVDMEYYSADSDRTVLLQDETVIKLLSLYLRLPPVARKEVFCRVFQTYGMLNDMRAFLARKTTQPSF